mgnify:CR=1 FL=1
MLIIGVDDTDTLKSRGTGSLARHIATSLAAEHLVLGVTRHQLLEDPRVPCTAKNSSAAILVQAEGIDIEALAQRVRSIMLINFNPGSDPGLCVAENIPPEVIEFGRCVQKEMVSQQQARSLAADHGVWLRGLGGDEDGVIGALAAVGLAACGEDGRYVTVGQTRDLRGKLPIAEILAAGVDSVRTLAGAEVNRGVVDAWKLRPARRGGKPVLYVKRKRTYWEALKGVEERQSKWINRLQKLPLLSLLTD